MAAATQPGLTRGTSVQMTTFVHTNARGATEGGTVLTRSVRPLIEDCETTLLHAHPEEGLIHNVKPTCPLTKGVYRDPVFCKNLNAVLERAAFIDYFTTAYIQRISSVQFTPSNVQMGCLEGATVNNYLILFPLTHDKDAPSDRFKLSSQAVIYSVKEAQIRLAAAPTTSPCIFDDEIRRLIENYMGYEYEDKKRDHVLIEAIHNRRTALGLETKTDHLPRGPDLSHLNLSALTIRNLNIQRRTVVNANFSNCPLIVDCCFHDTRFIGCTFENSNVRDCNFGGHSQSFYHTSMQNTGFVKNSNLDLPDANGGLNRRATTLEEYRSKLESLGALNTGSLREFVFEESDSTSSPVGAFGTDHLVARVDSIQAKETSEQAGPAGECTPAVRTNVASKNTPDDASEASRNKKPRVVAPTTES